MTITSSVQVNGQVATLDSWEDCIAVGAEIVQLISNWLNTPTKRVLYVKREDPIQVYIYIYVIAPSP